MSKEDFTLPPTHIERMDMEAQRQTHERELAKIDAKKERSIARHEWVNNAVTELIPVGGIALLVTFLLFSLGYCTYQYNSQPRPVTNQHDVEIAKIEQQREAACLARGRNWFPAEAVDEFGYGHDGVCLPRGEHLDDLNGE